MINIGILSVCSVLCVWCMCCIRYATSLSNYPIHHHDELLPQCRPFYETSPRSHQLSMLELEHLTYCDKISDYHFKTPFHPRYHNSTDFIPMSNKTVAAVAAARIVSLEYCRYAENLLVFEGISHPTISPLYSHITQQQFSTPISRHYHSQGGHAYHHAHGKIMPELPNAEQLQSMYRSHKNVSQLPIETTVGWLSFTIYDVIKTNSNKSDVSLCYSSEVITYTPVSCPYESRTVFNERKQVFEGNSYFFSMKSINRAVLWSPVADNGDGRYLLKIRVDDPGDYEIRVYRDQIRGCQDVDCNVPSSICSTYLNSTEMERCAQDNVCMELVNTMNITVKSSPRWPLWKAAGSALPPQCPADEIGIVGGRWVNPSVLMSEYNYTMNQILGFDSWPYVWAPYDCYIPSISANCLKSCLDKHKVAFAGLSRERTNSFDAEDFFGHHTVYQRAQNALIIGDNYYFPVYFQQIEDRKYWAEDNYYLNTTLEVTLFDLNDYKLCNLTGKVLDDNGEGRKQLGFLVNEEIYWFSTNTARAKWNALSGYFHKNLVDFCRKDNVTFVYKTSIPVSAQAKEVTWQKFLQATRQSAKTAVHYGMRVVDAYMLTMPMLLDRSVLPDGVHLYSLIKYQGNYVSKTATLMFMKLFCPTCQD